MVVTGGLQVLKDELIECIVLLEVVDGIVESHDGDYGLGNAGVLVKTVHIDDSKGGCLDSFMQTHINILTIVIMI